MQNISREAEEKHLTSTLAIIENHLKHYEKESGRMQQEIEEMLEHYHDNDVELWTLLNNTITLNEHMKRALDNSRRALDKPYFGRIVFTDIASGKEESLYIGKSGISDGPVKQLVVDWRAPVANAYYENGLGRCSYTAPEGKQIPIVLSLKRTFEIVKGKLANYFDTEVVANDDLLTKYLSRSKEAVLGEIVATIQKEQNEIIRKSPHHNMIVQGVAGSGKTTVAMHRISYILYRYKEKFRPEDFYIVGSNRILLNYITGVLPDLDVYGVRQMTMEQLFTRLLYEDWDEKKYHIQEKVPPEDTVKGTSEWYQALIRFIRRLEKNSLPVKSIYINQGLPSEAELLSGEAVLRYIRQNPLVSIQSKINMLNERLLGKVKDAFLGKELTYPKEEQAEILREYRGFFGKKSFPKSIFELYQEFLLEQRKKGLDCCIPSDSFHVYDLAALALLYKLVKETEVISEAHHIVIDEAQDFGMFVYHALHTCIKDCTYTIMGDVSQNIHSGYGLEDWEALRRLLLKDERAYFGLLKKSYRNTIEISEFATNILRHGDFPFYPVEPIVRHGKKPDLRRVAENTPEAFAAKTAAICRDWQKRGLQTIAVICRRDEDAEKAATLLSRFLSIRESSPEEADFGSGVMVLPISYTKGLEFDAVLIWNPSKEDYPEDNAHARLLYVAATRALHELCLLYHDSLTELVSPIAAPSLTMPSDSEQGTLLPSRKPVQQQKVLPRAEKSTVPVKSPAKPLSQKAGKKPIIILPGNRSETADPGQPAVQHKATSAAPLKPAGSGSHNGGLHFGDIPPTELLRLPGHSKISSGIRWCEKQNDGLYLQSPYGIIRITPVGQAILRITFSREKKILDKRHPFISTGHMEKQWKIRENSRLITFQTNEIRLEIDKQTGTFHYMDASGKILLNENPVRNRLSEKGRYYLFPDFAKKEQLSGIQPGAEKPLVLRSQAKILYGKGDLHLPLILSDSGYGIVPAASELCYFCDIAAYGTYLCMESEQQDFYFLAGKQPNTLLGAYAYLAGI